jgi:tripartite-type tricarboxylate transporter receptor subunit TctC
MMSKLACAAATVVSALALAAASAADYPAKPIRLIVPFPPGGTLDVVARGLSPQLAADLGQPIVIENRAGANGAVAYEFVSRAAADGYMLLIGGGTALAPHPAILQKLPYDPAKAFIPVAMLATFPSVLIANPSFPANSVEELVAAAKSAPGKITYRTPGTGNPNHLVAEWFQSATGITMVHAPYKGAALVVTDVVGGHIPIGFVLLPGALTQMRSGKLKALGVAAPQRVAAAPDVPTMGEAGVPALDLADWSGILVPAGTPASIVARLNESVTKVVNSPEIRKRWIEQGIEPRTATPAELATRVKSDIAKWNRIVEQAGIRLD